MNTTITKAITIGLLIGLASYGGDARANSDAAAKDSQTTPVAAKKAPGGLTGTVLETMDGGGYTYLKLDNGAENPWIAIPQASVKAGDSISCQPGMVMKNFSSKTLNKTFDAIVFSSGLIGGGGGRTMSGMANPHAKPAGIGIGGDDSFASAVAAEGGSPQAAMPPQGAASGGSIGAMAPYSEIKVEKASGDNAYIVGDVFEKSGELNGKTVRVQGKVIKFSPMIMGRNWVHLQDGSGDPLKNTHDLVFTTGETVEKGAVVTMEGVMVANKDFGAGYKYDAIVENSKVVK